MPETSKFQPVFEKSGEVRKVQKGWGHELWIANNDRYCGKVLHYDRKGVVSSSHFHSDKIESFFAMGRFLFYYKDTKGFTVHATLERGDVVHIPACTPHQLEPLEDGAEIFEVSILHDDNDVIRIGPGASQGQHQESASTGFCADNKPETARELLRQILEKAKKQDVEYRLREKEKNNVIIGDSWMVHYLNELQVLLSNPQK